MDVMNKFNAWELSAFIVRLQAASKGLEHRRLTEGGDAAIDEDVSKAFQALLTEAHRICKPLAFNNLLQKLPMLEQYVLHDSTVARLGIEIEHLRQEILGELHGRIFLWIPTADASLVDNDLLFGDAVRLAFPSARYDIRESGNCLSTGCNTAAVFHLMRVAEFGLRALAFDRRVKIPKGPIELATWEEIIRQLEVAEQSIQNHRKTLVREAQFEFYHGAMMELKRFKNKFRNQVMHTRDEYGPDEAKGAFTHVKAFMQILSEKISESKRTPLIWKKS